MIAFQRRLTQFGRAAIRPERGRPARLSAVVLALALVAGGRAAGAQDAGGWTEPIELSEGIVDVTGQPATGHSPSVAADPWGRVHAVWLIDSDPLTGSAYDTIYYANREVNGEWSEPTDIHYDRSGNFWQPKVVADLEGRLHLAWTNNNRLVYSRANVAEAAAAIGWSAPVVVSDLAALNGTLALGPDGRLHAAFCLTADDGYVAYTSSSDGRNWETAVQLAAAQDCWPRMAADGRGRVHLVFADQPAPGPPKGAYYFRSDDGGITWGEARLIDGHGDGYEGNYGPAYPNVVASGDDEIHIVWDGRPLGQRWHEWSADGGVTWSAPEQVNDSQRGLTIPNALAFDSAGVLHLITLGWLDFGDLLSGAFYTSYQGGVWSALETIGEREWAPEAPSATVASGNELVAVWHNLNDERMEIWATSRTLAAPFVGPPAEAPNPAAAATAAPTAIQSATDASPATPSPAALPAASSQRSLAVDTDTVVLISSAGVVAILSIAVFVRLRARSRSGSGKS